MSQTYSLNLGGISYNGRIIKSRYSYNDAIALKYQGDQGPIATLSTNVDGITSEEVAIKSYSENEGLYQQLIELGIITPAHRFVLSGHVSIPVCKRLI